MNQVFFVCRLCCVVGLCAGLGFLGYTPQAAAGDAVVGGACEHNCNGTSTLTCTAETGKTCSETFASCTNGDPNTGECKDDEYKCTGTGCKTSKMSDKCE